MARQSVTLILQEHDWIFPLLCGDLDADDIDLQVVRGNMFDAERDPETQACEMSFSRYVRRVASGDHDWVGLPAFVRREFCHRAWYVHRDSGYTQFGDLAGKTVGTNAWLATGNTWARAAARADGLDLSTIHWTVGPIDVSTGSRGDVLPANGSHVEPGQVLGVLLTERQLDALVCPLPPSAFVGPDAMIVRLKRDFGTAERDYYERVGVFPAHHIVAIRRQAFEASPRVAVSTFAVLETAHRRWTASRLLESDTSPWLVEDLEDAMARMGPDWQAYGVEKNRTMIQALCDEMLAQGLIDRSVGVDEVFSDYSGVLA
jgi:4,5-dihydroxyphthalate decarboxylase